MKKIILFVAGFIWSATVFSADLFECLGPDLIRSIIAPTTTNNDIAISTDRPEGLGDYIVPDELEWIGAIHGEISKTIALRTSLPVDAAQDLAVASLGSAGWEQMASPSMAPLVFTFGADPISQVNLCREGVSGGLLVRDVDGMRYINMRYSLQQQSSICSRGGRPPGLASMMGAMADVAPVLNFPAGTTRTGGTGSGGSGRDMRMTTSIVSDRSPQALVDVLGRQMLEQGWTFDSNWSGRHGAGATWVRDQGQRAVGTLEIIEGADDDFDVQFRLRVL